MDLHRRDLLLVVSQVEITVEDPAVFTTPWSRRGARRSGGSIPDCRSRVRAFPARTTDAASARRVTSNCLIRLSFSLQNVEAKVLTIQRVTG
jgi:hypothetical protein